MRRIRIVLILVFLLASAMCVKPGRIPIMDYRNITKKSVCMPGKKFPQMVMIPFFNRASQIVHRCDVYPNYQIALAFLVFYYTWTEYFGDEGHVVGGLLEDVMIEWGDEIKTIKKGYSIDGEPFTNRNIIGLVRSSTVIWVHEGMDRRLSQTSLIHELVHLAIRAHNGVHGDPDHEGDKYDGWTFAHTKMINEAKGVLRAFGL